MVSIIVPSYKEPYLKQTLGSLLDNAAGDIEIFAILDGYTSDVPLPKDRRLKILRLDQNVGMRGAVNAGLTNATGDYVMKTDAHCLFAEGYDKILTADCAENWLVIPRRYPLHADDWRIADPKSIKDYHYLSSPTLSSSYGRSIYPLAWEQRTKERINMPQYDIDDTMTMQGSCYLANRKYFMQHVGFLDDSPNTYDSFTGEPLEVGLKYWLNGGELKVNKKTWYAHLYKNIRFYRDRYDLKKKKINMHKKARHEWGGRHWLNNEEPGMQHKFEWLVDKFWPIPDWPEDWRDQWSKLSAN